MIILIHSVDSFTHPYNHTTARQLNLPNQDPLTTAELVALFARARSMNAPFTLNRVKDYVRETGLRYLCMTARRTLSRHTFTNATHIRMGRLVLMHICTRSFALPLRAGWWRTPTRRRATEWCRQVASASIWSLPWPE